MLYTLTVTSIFTVPDFCGVPPSTAISFRCKCACCSLSNGFCSSISTDLLPSWLVTCFNSK
uniref:Uncharacterized protein n=1 Tax=Oryzias latipes TaxID=8090 RepID=A0A3P9L0H7_ORYLA